MTIIIALILGSAFMVALGVASLSKASPMRRRLARLQDGSVAILETQQTGGVLGDPKQSRLIATLAALGGKTTDRRATAQHPVRRRLTQAGYRTESAVVVFMGTRLLLSLGLPVILLALSPVWGLGEIRLAAVLCGAAGLGFVAPSYFLDSVRKKRQRNLILGLPDALDLMVVCVEAGLGINASLSRIAREFGRSNRTLATEFEMVTLEVRTGKSTTEALRALADRTGVSEIGSLVAMLVQTERFGTSLADTLRTHADGLRVQRMLRAEELATKAPLKMMFPTLLIFIATLIVTIGPGVYQIMGFFEKAS